MRFPGSILLKVGLGKDSYARSILWVESRRQQEQIEKKRTKNIIASSMVIDDKDTTGGSSSADEESDNWGHDTLSGKKVSLVDSVDIYIRDLGYDYAFFFMFCSIEFIKLI